MEEQPPVKLDEGATETCRPAGMSRRTERESKDGFQTKHSSSFQPRLCRKQNQIFLHTHLTKIKVIKRV